MKSAIYFIVLISGIFAFSSARAGSSSKSKAKTGPVPIVSLEAAQNAGISERELSEANKLYTAKCIRCHKSYEPAGYSQELWDSWMTKMSKKAHLSTEQESLLRRYLAAYRANAFTAATNGHVALSGNQAHQKVD